MCFCSLSLSGFRFSLSPSRAPAPAPPLFAAARSPLFAGAPEWWLEEEISTKKSGLLALAQVVLFENGPPHAGIKAEAEAAERRSSPPRAWRRGRKAPSEESNKGPWEPLRR